MHILWEGDQDRPEGALEYSLEQLSTVHGNNRHSSILIVNPSDTYEGETITKGGPWFEVHTEHNVKDIDHKFWVNSTIEKRAGLLSGFELDTSIGMIKALRAKKLPEGAKDASILFINGPNLNLLGTREPEIYGNQTLNDIFASMKNRHPELDFKAMQSNAEHDIVAAIQNARGQFDAIVINAAAYTHTSVAIHDALKNFDDIIIELHISNPHQREDFRHRSYITPVAHGLIAGFGPRGYELAIMGVVSKL